jgi:hypothetical protein
MEPDTGAAAAAGCGKSSAQEICDAIRAQVVSGVTKVARRGAHVSTAGRMENLPIWISALDFVSNLPGRSNTTISHADSSPHLVATFSPLDSKEECKNDEWHAPECGKDKKTFISIPRGWSLSRNLF